MKNYLFTIILLISFFGCSLNKTKEDKDISDITKPKTAGQIPGGLKERTMSSEEGIIFGRKKNNESPFASNNIIWRAALSALDFAPLNTANYAGGIIVTDWYSPTQSQANAVKISVEFFSNEVSTNSFEVSGFERKCIDNSFNCTIIKTSLNFNQKIKDKILLEARKIALMQKK